MVDTKSPSGVKSHSNKMLIEMLVDHVTDHGDRPDDEAAEERLVLETEILNRMDGAK